MEWTGVGWRHLYSSTFHPSRPGAGAINGYEIRIGRTHLDPNPDDGRLPLAPTTNSSRSFVADTPVGSNRPMDTSAAMTMDHHRAAPSLSTEEKRRIERVARCVARDRDGGDLTEKLLLRLLGLTRNARRWGFLAPDHPLHPYYLQHKVSERCRILRPRHAAADRR